MRVKIENYQAIRNADLELNKGLTAIVGPTNSGKSSLIRAIKGAINNQKGTDFVTYDMDECRVTIIENDSEIIWTKPVKKPATYTLNGREIAKVGVSQNEEVAELLNMTEVEVDGTKIRLNFWEQMEKAFLMDKTPQQLFGFISQSKEQEIVKDYKDKTDQDISELGKEINTNTTKLDILSQDISRLKTRETELSRFESFDIELIEHLYNSRNALELNLRVFKETFTDINALDKNINLNKVIVKALGVKLDELGKVIGLRESIVKTHTTRDELGREYTKALTNLNTMLDSKGSLEEKIRELTSIIGEHSEAEKQRQNLVISLNNVKTINNNINTILGEINTLNQERLGLEKKLSEFKVCPFCGSDLSSQEHNH